MRLFIAIDIPENEKILSALRYLRGTGRNIKPVEEENLHLTLVFLGEVRNVAGVREVLSGIKFGKFRVSLRGVGAFPSLNRPRVVWIGVDQGREEMQELRNRIISGLKRIGIEPDEEESRFSPHLTLGRVKGPIDPGVFSEFLKTFSQEDFGEFIAEEVHLFRSDLNPSGPVYTRIQSVKLLE